MKKFEWGKGGIIWSGARYAFSLDFAPDWVWEFTCGHFKNKAYILISSIRNKKHNIKGLEFIFFPFKVTVKL